MNSYLADVTRLQPDGGTRATNRIGAIRHWISRRRGSSTATEARRHGRQTELPLLIAYNPYCIAVKALTGGRF